MNIKTIFNKQNGFTLIELLVVIAIIGILSSVVLASVSNSRAKARDARRKSDLSEIKTALELYNAKCGTYIVKKSCTGTGVYGANGSGYFNKVNYTGSQGSVGSGLVFTGNMSREAIDPSGKTMSDSAYMIYVSGLNYTIWAMLEKPTTYDFNTLNGCSLSNYDNYLNGLKITGGGHNYCISN